MADTQVTVRPDGTISAGSYTATGAASLHLATSDNSDSSYATPSGLSPMVLSLATTTVPALAVIHSVRIRVRAGGGSGQTGDASLQDASGNGAPLGSFGGAGSIQTFTLGTTTTTPSGGPWTQADIDGLRVGISNVGGSVVYEIYVDVFYNQAPTVTVTAPAATVTTTTTPTVAWTYADPDGDAQERYRMRVFSSSVYGAGGFDPDTSPVVYDSFDVLSAAPSSVIGSALTNGLTYRAYVKVADAGSGGRFGDWDYAEFGVAVDPPATPTLTASLDAANARTVLTAQAADNELSTNQADIETDTSGWVAETNCTLSRGTSVAAAHGNAFLILTASANGDISAKTSSGTSGVRVFGGTTYTGLLKVRADTTGRFAYVYLNWYTSAGTLISQVQSTLVSSTTSSWTQASITTTAPINAAYASIQANIQSALASERHFVDAALIAPGTSTTWRRGGLVAGQRIVIERSADSGGTWDAVRLSPTAPINVADLTDPGQFGTFYDYEAPPNVAVIYRARITTSDAGSVLDSLYTATTSPLTFSPTTTWFKDPLDPTLNTTVDLNDLTITKPQQRAEYSPLGRDRDVVLYGQRTGETGTLEIEVVGNAALADIDALLDNRRTLLLQTPIGDNLYVSCGDRERADQFVSDTSDGWRLVHIPIVEVDAP